MTSESSLFGPHPSLFAGSIGIARVDITPPVGIYARNWGAAAHDTAQSVHRPLTLNALTIRAGSEPPLVLVDADLGFWSSLERFQRMRRNVLRELQLDSPNFVFAMTHTHASPHLCDPQPGMAGGELLEQWLAELEASTLRAVRAAFENEQKSTLDWHTGRCQLAAIRDLPDPTGERNRYVCGYHPGRQADDTLLLGRVCDAQGAVRAVIVNYACHPTTLAWSNTSLSPDFIGAMRETLEAYAVGALAFFLQGASGELAPRYQYVGDPSVADRHGRQLGYAALATLEDMEPPGTRLQFEAIVESGAPLAVWKPAPIEPSRMLAALESKVSLSLKPDLPSAEELDFEYRNCNDRAIAERLRRKRNLRRVLGDSDSFDMPIWAWKVGDAFLVGCMAEAYSMAQTTLRERFAGRHVACVNLINGTIGYLPPAESYDLDLYQVWQSPFARGCLERYITALGELIERLESG